MIHYFANGPYNPNPDSPAKAGVHGGVGEVGTADVDTPKRMATPLFITSCDLNNDIVITRRPYSGMFPCFFGGELSTLLASIRSALMITGRVSAGSITSSR